MKKHFSTLILMIINEKVLIYNEFFEFILNNLKQFIVKFFFNKNILRI